MEALSNAARARRDDELSRQTQDLRPWFGLGARSSIDVTRTSGAVTAVRSTMTVLHAVRTATISSQAEPAATPLPSAPPRTAQPVGRDRPLTADERMCAIGLTMMAVVLGSIIVAFLLLAELVWV